MVTIVELAKQKGYNNICLICGGEYSYLGSHVWHKHKITSKEYKELFGMPHNLKLISDGVRDKKIVAFNKDKEKYLKNLSTKTQFKKGYTRYGKGCYFSRLEREHLKDRLPDCAGTCPICKTKFKHLNSHLFNKHGLLKVGVKNE